MTALLKQEDINKLIIDNIQNTIHPVCRGGRIVLSEFLIVLPSECCQCVSSRHSQQTDIPESQFDIPSKNWTRSQPKYPQLHDFVGLTYQSKRVPGWMIYVELGYS
jgi:hypothetical protein